MPTHQQFQVEPGVQPYPRGYGFYIGNQYHRPLFSVVYSTRAEAETARAAIEAALGNAIEVNNYP